MDSSFRVLQSPWAVGRGGDLGKFQSGSPSPQHFLLDKLFTIVASFPRAFTPQLSNKDSWNESPNPTQGSDLRGPCLNWLPSELLPYSLTSTRKAREREKGAGTKRMWLGAWSGVVPSEELGRGSGVAPCLALGNLISSLLTIY